MKITKIIFLFISFQIFGQITQTKSHYEKAMDFYDNKDYNNSSINFSKLIKEKGYDLSTSKLYNGVCIFSLNQEYQKAIEVLKILAFDKYYSNPQRISSDNDLKQLRDFPEWNSILEQVKKNEQTLPERTREKIKSELFKAKDILNSDNGKLWGYNIWSEDILVLDGKNTIYSLKKLPDSQTKDSIIFFEKVPENTIFQSNTTQEYNGKKHAIILTNYLDDNSSTIIHELFHILHEKKTTLNGLPIDYLENCDARKWLRLEFQALRNTINSIIQKQKRSKVLINLNDALLYRKLRQTKYKLFTEKELEIETLEGLANYTGYKLSSYSDKYEQAIKEINLREKADTYTRAFPYATGLTYGLIFDYLQVDWKKGLNKVYDFLNIYESQCLKKQVVVNDSAIEDANQRCNYKTINNQEMKRKQEFDKNASYYNELLVNSPTLSVTLNDKLFGKTFDMNGTFVLNGLGIVYSKLTGTDGSGGANFGNFKTLPEKEKLGFSGILEISKELKFVFPLPLKIDGNLIIGEFYQIELNKGWKVEEVNSKGDLSIVKMK